MSSMRRIWLRSSQKCEVYHGETIGLTYKQKDVSAITDLTDLQCLWFLQEEGDAHRRNGDLAMALKRYQALVNVSASTHSVECTEADPGIPRLRGRSV